MNESLRIAVAGLGSMGNPLLKRLHAEGYNVPLVFTRRELWIKNRLERSCSSPTEIGQLIERIDPFTDEIDIMFFAIPSNADEVALIEHCLSKGIYMILMCKHALAYEYERLRAHRHMFGANATVGGRTMILPWLRMQHLYGRKFVMFAYLNASSNYFMHNAVEVGSPRGVFEDTRDLHLAEPGSDDFVSFINGEIGGDYPKKVSILMNDTVLGNGPYLTPDSFDPYIPLSMKDVYERTLPSRNDRYLVRIDNLGLDPQFERGKPGSLYAEHNGFIVSGGFYDLGRGDAISRWIKGGKANGVQIRFDGDHSSEGTVEIAGLGAGEATVGAAMNDLYQFVAARDGTLIEASWPMRLQGARRLSKIA